MRILVDLTPILPDGANGGAKIMTLALINEMASLKPNYQFYLLGNAINANELVKLETKNIIFINMANLIKNSFIDIPILNKIRSFLKKQSIYDAIKKKSKADLLFCPFTSPSFHPLKLPIVSIIYDLQYHYYPEFFTESDRKQRKNAFELTINKADRIITISNFVKSTILANSHLAAHNIKTIPIQLTRQSHETRNSNALHTKHYLLYPANFWAHKNHEALLNAFLLYRTQYSDTNLKLVLTGSSCERKTLLQSKINKLNLNESVLLPGYLPDETLANLMHHAHAMIFPSLYEGFGMPIIEAMAAGVPVLCSNVTSLPEVAGDAAIYFDPENPQEIADSIAKINNPEVRKEMIQRGLKQSRHFESTKQMAAEYLEVFEELLQSRT